MKIWKNTTIFNDYIKDFKFTNNKATADLILLGSKSINLNEFISAKAIFRAGIGRDNVPENDALERGIIVRYPSKETVNIIFEETANYTCNLIFKMAYDKIGSIDPWKRVMRTQLSDKKLLVIGVGNIGSRVKNKMKNFMNVFSYDSIHNEEKELKFMISSSDFISLHIPKSKKNEAFINSKKLSWMKDNASLINTSRASIVSEDDLYNELKLGRLKAAFDVFWKEPYNGKLMEFYPKIFYMSPHVSSSCSDFIISCTKDLKKLIKDLK